MELSGCGDKCRRTAKFYAALRCYEVLGLASVEWIPCLSGCKPSYTEICYNILPYPLPSSRYRQHTKNTTFTKTLCSQYYGKSKQLCRNVCIWSSGECNGWPVSHHEPLDTTLRCTSLNFLPAATSSIILPSLPNLFLQMVFFRAPKRQKSEGARSGLNGWWGRIVYPNVVITSHIFKFVLGTALHWRRSSATFFLGLKSPETLLQCFKCLNVQIWVMVWPHGIMSTKTTPSASQKTMSMTFPTEGIALNIIFWGEVGWWPSIDCLCVCGSSPVTVCDKKLSPLTS